MSAAVNNLEERLVSSARHCGISPEDAQRLAKILLSLDEARDTAKPPHGEWRGGAQELLGQVVSGGPFRIVNSKDDTTSGAIVMEERDLMLLRDTLLQFLLPRYVTGRELVARYGQEGAPSSLALQPPLGSPPEVPDIAADLAISAGCQSSD